MLPLNNNLHQLFTIAQKEEKLGIGLMSGTSLDGLDIALCRLKGHGMQTVFELVKFTSVSYTEDFKNEVREVFAKREVDLEKVCLLNAYIGTFHGGLVLEALAGWGLSVDEIDFIASHGQTIYHAPKRLHHQPGYPNATLQIGDGDHLAVKTGVLTISDFRQKHIAAGGEGAPLALYGDVLLTGRHSENRILLNIGGIANLTFLPGDGVDEQILCTDIGPGNTLIDAACRKYFDGPFDEDSKIAFSGKVNEELLAALQDNPFFYEKAPKTTGPELFNLEYVELAQQRSATMGINKEDLVCTISTFTGATIADFISVNFDIDGIQLFASGGGVRNIFVMEYLKKALPSVIIADTTALGINPDAKEAILFAVLGNEALCGEPLQIGNNPAVVMGKFSFSK
jgi:anhydro-N-acetylmuramic acid kinase